MKEDKLNIDDTVLEDLITSSTDDKKPIIICEANENHALLAKLEELKATDKVQIISPEEAELRHLGNGTHINPNINMENDYIQCSKLPLPDLDRILYGTVPKVLDILRQLKLSKKEKRALIEFPSYRLEEESKETYHARLKLQKALIKYRNEL